MSFRKYDASNTGRYHRLVPTMTFNRYGRASINGEAQRTLSPDAPLKAIEFIQNEERPKDWYIRAAAQDKGFVLRANSRGGQAKKITAIRFVNFIMDTLEIPNEVVTYRVASIPTEIEGEEWYAILTVKPIVK